MYLGASTIPSLIPIPNGSTFDNIINNSLGYAQAELEPDKQKDDYLRSVSHRSHVKLAFLCQEKPSLGLFAYHLWQWGFWFRLNSHQHVTDQSPHASFQAVLTCTLLHMTLASRLFWLISLLPLQHSPLKLARCSPVFCYHLCPHEIPLAIWISPK